MKYPQAVVWESGSRLANLLRSRASRRTWVLRQAVNADDCLSAFRNGRPNILVVEIGENAAAIFEGLERFHKAGWDPPMAVVIECGTNDSSWLAEYARCLGARVVLHGNPWPSDLVEAVEGLLRRGAASA